MKYLITILALSLSLMAAKAKETAKYLGVYNDYDKALNIAKSENKLLVLVVVWHPCNACDKVVEYTLADTAVKRKLKNHVMVILDFKDKMPKKFQTPVAPKIYYIDPKTETKILENIGSVSAEAFIAELEDSAEFI